jgi:hypothetical protein
MKVKELIEKLKEFDGELEVGYDNGEFVNEIITIGVCWVEPDSGEWEVDLDEDLEYVRTLVFI